MAPCFRGISLRTGAASIGIFQLLSAAVSGIYFALLVSGLCPIGNGHYSNCIELRIHVGVTAVLNLILGTLLSCGVLMDRKGWCKLWVYISTLHAILSLILTVILVISLFWAGLLFVVMLLIQVWLIVVVYEFTNETEEKPENEPRVQSEMCSTPQKIITDV